MGARTKLNAAYLKIAGIIAAILGIVTGSFLVFWLTFGIIVITALAGGDIRPDSTNRRRRR